MGSKSLGDWGEDFAACYLQKQGLTILDRNYRISAGEVDLIAKHKQTYVFVEIKTRRSAYFGLPAESVTAKKQARIIKATVHYLHKHKLSEQSIRFDVLSILRKVAGNADIEWIVDAFDATPED
jgi:putative endonuclease